MSIYGYKKLNGDFEKVIEITDAGFNFKDKEYQYKDIIKIKRYDSMFWNLLFYQGGTPRAYIYLNDNKCIKLFGKTLQKENEKMNNDFVTGASIAYHEVINALKENNNT